MPETNNYSQRYYPKLSEIITIEDLPEFLSFVQDRLNAIFDKIHYKNLQYSKSFRGDAAFYSLDIVTRKPIKLALPFDMALVLNPDLDGDGGISSFPITLEYQWEILAFLKTFSLEGFSFSLEDFYQTGLKIFRLTEDQVLAPPLPHDCIVWLQTTGDASDNDIDMDNLTYTYQNGNGLSNLLVNVADAVTTGSNEGFKDGNTDPILDDYEYDANGNMIKDRNKGISNITYNHLNLPTQIEFEGTNNKITYLYNSVGQKLKKTVVYSDSIKIVDYLDGFQYAGGELNFFPHPEGYVNVKRGGRTAPDGSQGYVFNYVYNYTDHLGNIRVSYSKDPQTHQLKILEENHYYPFGLKHSVYTAGRLKDFEVDSSNPEGEHVFLTPVTKTDYQYKFGAKEWQDELGLNLYDYHARNYDPALGRWQVIDPMAPKYFSHSPYAYTLNNPVYFIDPTGMMAEIGNLLGNGDPVEICEGCLVELEEALITAKDTQKSSSFGSRSRSGSLMTMSGFSSSRYSRVGNFWDAAYRNMLSPENKANYLKMRQAMHEGQVGVVVLFSSVVALPYAVTYGSVAVSSIESSALISSGQTALGNVITNQKVTEFLLRFSLDIGTQAIFNGGDFKLSDVTGAAVGALPFVPWYASGFAAEGTGLGTKALMGDQIDSNDVWSAGIKSFMISPLGAASGNAMEAVTNKTAGQVIEAVHNNAQGAMIDDQLSH